MPIKVVLLPLLVPLFHALNKLVKALFHIAHLVLNLPIIRIPPVPPPPLARHIHHHHHYHHRLSVILPWKKRMVASFKMMG